MPYLIWLLLLICHVELEHNIASQSFGHSTWPERINEWMGWPLTQRDPESIFSSVYRSHPLSTCRRERMCPWRSWCSITLCCSVSHMAEDAVLHYSLSHWEGQNSSSSSEAQESGYDLSYGLQLTQRKKIIDETGWEWTKKKWVWDVTVDPWCESLRSWLVLWFIFVQWFIFEVHSHFFFVVWYKKSDMCSRVLTDSSWTN